MLFCDIGTCDLHKQIGVQTKHDRREYNRLRHLYRAAWSFWTIRVICTCRTWHSGHTRLPAHFWTGISQPTLFPCRSWLISPPLLHPLLYLGSWSPPETHGAGRISLSPPGAPSGWRPVSAVPQADRSPVRGPVSLGWCQHTATISFIFSFIRIASDTPDASFAPCPSTLDAPFTLPPPESHVIAPFTLIFNVGLPLSSRLSHLVSMPLKETSSTGYSEILEQY